MAKQKEVLTPLAFIEKTLEEISRCDFNLKLINSEMDKQMFEIRANHSASITELQQAKDKAFNELQDFAIENQNLLFSIKRSMTTKFGSFGFRTGKPKFQLIPEISWSYITERLKDFLPQYVRTVVEPAKDKLLADRNIPEIARYFPSFGLSVVQDETFFVDLKK